jgi:dihydropteroate synthase
MKHTLVMGIVNVTPDSFSDGGKFFRPEEALARAHNMITEGANIIDLGGESTRPGATPLDPQTEWQRLKPVLTQLAASTKTPLSIDTYHPETAAQSIAHGATIINCVYPEPIPEMIRTIFSSGRKNIELILPASCLPLIQEANAKGPWPIPFYLDPMIGFGTSREEDLQLLSRIPSLARQGRVLIGASRKRIIKKLTGENVTGKNLGGNLGLAVWCALNGADAVRVHDVRETVQALRVFETLEAQTLC